MTKIEELVERFALPETIEHSAVKGSQQEWDEVWENVRKKYELFCIDFAFEKWYKEGENE